MTGMAAADVMESLVDDVHVAADIDSHSALDSWDGVMALSARDWHSSSIFFLFWLLLELLQLKAALRLERVEPQVG